MRIFTTKDATGKEFFWEINFTFSSLRRWKAETDLSLLTPDVAVNGNQTAVTLLYSDLDQFFRLLCVILRPQLEKAGISEENFADHLDDLKSARNAFFGEWSDFFTRAGMPPLAAVIDRTVEAMAEYAEKIRQIKPNEMPGLASTNLPA